MSLKTIREGLATRLATITSPARLHIYAVAPDAVNVPAAVIRPTRGDNQPTFAGRATYYVEIEVVVESARLDSAQLLLDGYLDVFGTGSIVAALEADVTLGGAAEGLLCGSWSDYGEFGGNQNQARYLSAVLPVEVWARA